MRVNRFVQPASIVSLFASLIAVFTCSAQVLASGNFPSPLLRSATPVRENVQTKVWEIFERLPSRSDKGEFQSYSASVSINGLGVSQTANLQPKGFERFNERLPFEWRVVSGKPLSHVLPEFSDYVATREITFEDLLRVFNIEVIVEPPHEFNHPNVTYLSFEIRSLERAIHVELPMHLELTQSSYFITNPAQVARELSFEMGRFEAPDDLSDRLKPWMKIKSLRGFREAVVHDAQVLASGIPITYKLRFGSFSVDSGFQKFGAWEYSKTRYPFEGFLH